MVIICETTMASNLTQIWSMSVIHSQCGCIVHAFTKWKCHACRLVLLACHVVTLASTGCDYTLQYFNYDLHPF